MMYFELLKFALLKAKYDSGSPVGGTDLHMRLKTNRAVQFWKFSLVA